jgi:hypothetical protein
MGLVFRNSVLPVLGLVRVLVLLQVPSSVPVRSQLLR